MQGDKTFSVIIGWFYNHLLYFIWFDLYQRKERYLVGLRWVENDFKEYAYIKLKMV